MGLVELEIVFNEFFVDGEVGLWSGVRGRGLNGLNFLFGVNF